MGVNLHNFELDNSFLDMIPNAQVIKIKNKSDSKLETVGFRSYWHAIYPKSIQDEHVKNHYNSTI